MVLDRRHLPIDHPNSVNYQSPLKGMLKRLLHRGQARWPASLWRATAVADCCLILGVHTFGLPRPPDGLTFAALLGVLVLAYFSAIACVMSR